MKDLINNLLVKMGLKKKYIICDTETSNVPSESNGFKITGTVKFINSRPQYTWFWKE